MPDNPRIEELRRRVESDPASIAFAQLAEEFRRAGQYQEAVAVCRAGLERHPSYLSARVTLGRALIELGRFDEAQTELNHVVRSAPGNLAAIRGMAEIHQRRGELGEALRQYQTALGIAKHDPEIEESVQDLTRQLGAREPNLTPTPAAPVSPPPIPVNGEVSHVASAAEAPRSAGDPPLAQMTPELEAAADEFTRALEALDALSVDLAKPKLVVEPPKAPVTASRPLEVPRAPEPKWTPEPTPAPAPSPAPAAAPKRMKEVARQAPLSEEAVLAQLEAWLQAIELDRKAGTYREALNSHS